MNKTQINFFCERAAIIERRVKRDHFDMYEYDPELSIEEMVGMIMNGQAKFKQEVFGSDRCPNLSGNTKRALKELYEFPDEDLRKATAATREKILDLVERRIYKYREDLEDQFVMKNIEDPKAALTEFEDKDFFTKDEHEKLSKICS